MSQEIQCRSLKDTGLKYTYKDRDSPKVASFPAIRTRDDPTKWITMLKLFVRIANKKNVKYPELKLVYVDATVPKVKIMNKTTDRISGKVTIPQFVRAACYESPVVVKAPASVVQKSIVKKSARKSATKSATPSRPTTSPCPSRKSEQACGGDPNCTWTKTGCRAGKSYHQGRRWEGPVRN